jgi:hypothetical protein
MLYSEEDIAAMELIETEAPAMPIIVTAAFTTTGPSIQTAENSVTCQELRRE